MGNSIIQWRRSMVGRARCFKVWVIKGRRGRHSARADSRRGCYQGCYSNLPSLQPQLTNWTKATQLIGPFVSAQTHKDLSRFFWCPTGHAMFLPIHAADMGVKCPTSSPRQTSLLSAFLHHRPIPIVSRRVAISVSSLFASHPQMAIELEHIRAVIRNSHEPSSWSRLSERSRKYLT